MAALSWPLMGLSCYDEDSDCSSRLFCDRNRPTHAELAILISKPGPVEVRVYSGPNFEDGTLIEVFDWPTWTEKHLTLPLGEYSVTALYVTAGDSLLAVDGDALDYSSEESCEGTCYETEDGEVDLRLD